MHVLEQGRAALGATVTLRVDDREQRAPVAASASYLSSLCFDEAMVPSIPYNRNLRCFATKYYLVDEDDDFTLHILSAEDGMRPAYRSPVKAVPCRPPPMSTGAATMGVIASTSAFQIAAT